MAIQTGRIGSLVDIIQYDDGVYATAIEVDDPIRVNSAPVDGADVLRLSDLDTYTVGPTGATDHAVARFDGVTGYIIQDSLVIISDAGGITIPDGLTIGSVTTPAAITIETDGDLLLPSATKIGIGTTPSYGIHIAVAGAPTIHVEDTTNNVALQLRSGDTDSDMGTVSGHALNIITNNTDRIKISDAGVVEIGGVTNYTTIEADGTVEFNGAATVWKDINLGAAQLGKPAAANPDSVKFLDEGGGDTGIYTDAFAVGEYISGSFEMQHDYKEGSNIHFHIHWQGIAAPSGTDYVKWQLEYTMAQTGETLDATTTIVIETAFDTQYEFVRSDFAAITGTNFDIEDQFLFKLSRIAAVGDAYSGDALIATVGLHYEVNTVGSRAIGAK